MSQKWKGPLKYPSPLTNEPRSYLDKCYLGLQCSDPIAQQEQNDSSRDEDNSIHSLKKKSLKFKNIQYPCISMKKPDMLSALCSYNKILPIINLLREGI